MLFRSPGADLARLVERFPGLQVYRCDGTDYPDSFRTMGQAVAHVRTERTPALVHAKVIRPYSHSLSDDERLYKTPEERTAEARRDPIPRLRHLLLSQGYATEAQLAAMAAEVDEEVNAAALAALAAPKPDPDTAMRYEIGRAHV